jgi:hypothetical protein
MTSSGVKYSVRYWGLLLGKFAVAGSIVLTVQFAINRFWPSPKGYDSVYLGFLLAECLLFSTGIAMFYLAILDQRYRCRVCLRRLRMPVERGSWSNMLQFGRPKIEYICTYGHGKLNIAELQITGIENPEWTEHADYWAELCGTGKGNDPSGR